MNEPAVKENVDADVVLGIDVGWSEKKHTTGACVLRWTQHQVTLNVHHVPTNFDQRRDKLIQIVGADKFAVVALDGPLRKGFDTIGEYRLAELLLTQRFSNSGFGKPGQSSSPNGIMLNIHANEIARSVIAAQCVMASSHAGAIDDAAIVEAFPTTFLGVMLQGKRPPSSKAKSDIFYEWLLGPDAPARHFPDENRIVSLIQAILPGRSVETPIADITDHEHRAAVVCALTALCVARNRYVAVGDSRNGYIILPPYADDGTSGLQPWAMSMIRANAKKPARSKKYSLAQIPPTPHVIEVNGSETKTLNISFPMHALNSSTTS